MIQKFLLSIFVTTVLFSVEVQRGEKLKLFVLPDQFGTYHTVSRHTKTIIVSFQKGTGAIVNEYLNKKPKDYLEKRDAVFIANISAMPEIITRMFAMPKLKKFRHTILLINDEADNRFRAKEDKITVYTLENFKVLNISYLASAAELEKLL